MQKQNNGWNNLLLLSGVVFMIVVPLMIVRNSEFAGADTQAKEAIQTVKPDYQPWFNPILEPPGSETESLLFALQAAIGAGAMGFIIGLYSARAEKNQ
ncbi:MAG: energy-coupling factor ABC transporter substrate-binding protein [Oscillatoriaceae bacterium SKW80]|nr:energy-coupling factor ABC transporter substrate-binding protein [Oscillatoriaceae bacterium SKYG93]MCX8120879.1 energy-coupling factor ABC transporter substrate-binding protein [Oscillatoriaceae bacterium SKW80]MDW8452152.1 energy-coupling factor ABC transporter substrate-binding protein [Oscillatoriaceae cyanobacterium SKYGB_i_bin93]HIK27362.1 energy-coupling factor ABC transporter substrate-binding protein [Oscillatoriaceae cyanobacterium M7585_C2015_266]